MKKLARAPRWGHGATLEFSAHALNKKKESGNPQRKRHYINRNGP
jgi:hypothetical protein